MKAFIILFGSIAFTIANQCNNLGEELGSPIAGGFLQTGFANTHLLNIQEDQQQNLLYFIGFYTFGASSFRTIIYKSDYNLVKIKVVTYDANPQFRSPKITPNGDFIYLQVYNTGKMVEIDTSDLSITRELTLSSTLF